jgi:hypothetical protein
MPRSLYSQRFAVWRAGMEDADDFDADLKHVDWSGDALMFF